ncbi:hypothetical protein [Nostoc sp. CHAB 5715]|uniref:hypothetical protein n=1 Tax=Nostoc sp. CHAB 5715 TaxID=2780400 RepID=UPI001E395128|nr:hypothetical protein [Nostoc sp. CHAB 5715]MCC5624294.1 hypothetical protein [Nostoc sp. CHAB 5715]
MGHGEELPMPNAQCPKSAGGYPSPPTRGWSFPPTFNKLLLLVGWTSCPSSRARRAPHKRSWMFFYLEVPDYGLGM